MIIGIPKEIKTKETRVSVTPQGVAKLVQEGHRVLVQQNVGLSSGFKDDDYKGAGATLLGDGTAVWEQAELIVKVKEPVESEYRYLKPGLSLFTYLHLASVPPLMEALCQNKVTGIGYETVELSDGELPLLTPMSEVAGRIATQIGTYLLHSNHGGKGLLLGGVTGTRKGLVTVIGAGHVGLNAAEVALGLRSEVVVLDIKEAKLKLIEQKFGGKVKAIASTPQSVSQWAQKSDLVVGAVLVSGDKAPIVITKEMVGAMDEGSVIVDVAIDQGGCVATSRPTTHAEPTYKERGVIHYCVTNMPALTPRTSTEALTTATLPYLLKLANQGIEKALASDPALKLGLQTRNGKAIHSAIQKLFPNWV
ncbi:MAG: alanine dehydrogenase [Deltaproteobacteria bacterium RIFCSPLOWO2_01_44_7]|nr:MAG: alanine dehydrogenase [Deltaproteobacteria bacterium RIFCSPHIGHO2_01_FULL_43_49]OGQ14713.1 MAG: alanine dehydrogenase [Deltaproteobacteria bacterium RIFCSPHIGHO2_02_FULL_44_53]OGQ28099.1 MAG: alanine dehydrogenase [Deltaproteobacteria bacterium RIFCSPHIGHO2_12_FULL_44_21]OGQ31311.1 MAG: alanine dehydrogenase [Deltaproteobacteria bacterium RIFCSPLOWO2_01_FULL_45_74]OGQ40810.1 MAG: alanine dehydrogenase [Deltaproteobacteria bacterium RIFCSPLOWO2_01_44_7]OGQ43303.1 MAG: alanine dehydrogen